MLTTNKSDWTAISVLTEMLDFTKFFIAALPLLADYQTAYDFYCFYILIIFMDFIAAEYTDPLGMQLKNQMN